jgi:MFS family permease
MLGGVIAARWGWHAAFGVVGFPGLLIALLYMKVRDYRTVELTPALERATHSVAGVLHRVWQKLWSPPTMLFVCVGGAAQLIVVSAIWSWLPSFLNRVHGVAPDQAGVRAALIVLCGAIGSVAWGALVDRAGAQKPRNKLYAMAVLCLLSLFLLALAFAAPALGWAVEPSMQFGLIAAGGFVMTCTVGPVAAVVIDVIHPGVRATGSAVLALFQNLFGLAAGPFIAGLLSDTFSLPVALAVMPLFAIIAAVAFVCAASTYEADAARAAAPH